MPLEDMNGKGIYNINAIYEGNGNYVIMIGDLDAFGTNSPNGYPTTTTQSNDQPFYHA